MIRSMTGFGRGEYLDEQHRFIVEIKAVNHRYNEIVIRMPRNLGILEDKIRRIVGNTLSRGRIDIFINLDDYGARKRIVRVDKKLAVAYQNALKELSECIATPTYSSADRIAQYSDVLKVEDSAEDVNELWLKLGSAIEVALAKHIEMREAEGEAILRDLGKRINKIERDINSIVTRAPEVLKEYKDRVLGRMKETLALIKAEPDEIRLLQEIALFADRTSITEELVRLKSHLVQLGSTLIEGVTVGRKMDFIIQEINREINTIASKANDFTIANIVIEIKSEIEQVREQIQNIE